MITVAMPLRDAGSIAWLALTALTRQVDAPPWELLVIEDQTVDAVAAETWAFYGPLLGAAGCVRFELFKPEGWPALSEKWRRLARRASPSSVGFLLCAGDDYSPPARLAATYDVIHRSRADWVHWPAGYFWTRGSSAVSLFDLHAEGYDGVTGCWMAARTDAVRHLPTADVRKGVDGWMRGSIGRAVGGDLLEAEVAGDEWQSGLHTDGWNLISRHRAHMCAAEHGPFSRTATQLASIVPEDVAERLML